MVNVREQATDLTQRHITFLPERELYLTWCPFSHLVSISHIIFRQTEKNMVFSPFGRVPNGTLCPD